MQLRKHGVESMRINSKLNTKLMVYHTAIKLRQTDLGIIVGCGHVEAAKINNVSHER
jgi:hypothetical protein